MLYIALIIHLHTETVAYYNDDEDNNEKLIVEISWKDDVFRFKLEFQIGINKDTQKHNHECLRKYVTGITLKWIKGSG